MKTLAPDTAPDTTQIAMEGRGPVIYVPTAECTPNLWNRKNFDQAKLEDMAQSMRRVGVLEPLLVRLLPPDKRNRGKYEIVAGERRWRAGKLAGLPELPCIVTELDDRGAREVMAIENLQREDLTAFEEAQIFAALITELGCKPEDLEKRLGKKRSHIYGRLRLLKTTPALQKALAEGRLDVSVANILATIPDPKKQEEATQLALEGRTVDWRNGHAVHEPMSFRAAKELVEEKFRAPLKGLNFELNEATWPTLPNVPSCEACPKRTGNIQGLPPGDGNVCTDPACLRRKIAAVHQLKLDAQSAKGFETLSLSESKKALRKKWDGTTEAGPGYVRASDVLEGDKKKRTYAQVLKDSDVKPLVGLSPGGGAVKVFRVADIKAPLKKAGVELAAEAEAARAAERSAARNKRWELENKRRALMEDACTKAIAEAFCGKKLGLSLPADTENLILAQWVDQNFMRFRDLAKAQGWKDGKLAGLTRGDRWAAFLVAEFVDDQFWDEDNQKEALRFLASLGGIDTKAILDQVAAQLNPKPHPLAHALPKADKAKATPSKPKSKKKK